MKATFEVLRATSADVPAITELTHKSPAAAHWTQGQYAAAIQAADGPFDRVVLVAREVSYQQTSPVLGFVVARHLSPEWELENIVVSAVSQRQGIGRCLLRSLLERAIETSSEAIFLEVRASNRAARSLYESAGFCQTGLRRFYYSNPPEDAILYRLTLGGSGLRDSISARG